MNRYSVLLIAMAMALSLLVLAACESDTEEEVASRLDTVQERGNVVCASRNDVPGYGSLDASGNNVGFDIGPVPSACRRSAGRPQRH